MRAVLAFDADLWHVRLMARFDKALPAAMVRTELLATALRWEAADSNVASEDT